MCLQGYELSDVEVKVSLEQFKSIYCGVDGSVTYVSCPLSNRPILGQPS